MILCIIKQVQNVHTHLSHSLMLFGFALARHNALHLSILLTHKHMHRHTHAHTHGDPQILPSHSLFNVKALLHGCPVQPEELNALLSVGVCVLLSGEQEVAVEQNEGPVGGKVCDWLHDVPGVLEPGEPGKAAKLDWTWTDWHVWWVKCASQCRDSHLSYTRCSNRKLHPTN